MSNSQTENNALGKVLDTKSEQERDKPRSLRRIVWTSFSREFTVILLLNLPCDNSSIYAVLAIRISPSFLSR